MNKPLGPRLWAAIDEYVRQCGGDTERFPLDSADGADVELEDRVNAALLEWATETLIAELCK